MAGILNKIEEELRDLEEWNDRHDVVGLSPGNWVSPIDFTPIGWINKGRKAYKAAKTGYKLGRRGLTIFGKAAYKESKRHSISAAGSLATKAMQRYESSGSSSGAYQQNGSPGDTKRKIILRAGIEAAHLGFRAVAGRGKSTKEWTTSRKGYCPPGYRPNYDKLGRRRGCKKISKSRRKK